MNSSQGDLNDSGTVPSDGGSDSEFQVSDDDEDNDDDDYSFQGNDLSLLPSLHRLYCE
jgi:hypothetical protein